MFIRKKWVIDKNIIHNTIHHSFNESLNSCFHFLVFRFYHKKFFLNLLDPPDKNALVKLGGSAACATVDMTLEDGFGFETR